MQVATQNRILDLATGAGEALWWFDGLVALKVTGEQSSRLFSLIEMLRPAGGVVPRHVHHREDELFYLIDGELEARVGDRTIQAKAGTTVWFYTRPRALRGSSVTRACERANSHSHHRRKRRRRPSRCGC